MNLYTFCSSCKDEIKIKSSASTRPELQMEKGDELRISCKNCGNIETKHINDIKAQSSKLILLVGVILGILSAVFLFNYLGLFSTVSFIIPFIFWQQQMAQTKSFNSYRVRRKQI